MIIDALTLVHYALLLAYGIVLSAAFAGVEPTRKNAAALGILFAGCSLAQLAAMAAFGEGLVWLAYPVLGHLPIALLLCLRYGKRAVSSLACIATAYMCCQPANWLGEFAFALSGNEILEQIVRITALVVSCVFVLRFAAGSLASIFEKSSREVLMFASVPFVYYAFDYSMSVYSEGWAGYSAPVAEFLPFLLCLVFLAFCVVYHQAYERRLESEQRERIVSMATEQLSKEIEAVRRGEERVRIIRHDMRFVMSNLLQCLDAGDVPSARKILEGYLEEVESTAVKRLCENDLVNYVISSYSARCEKAGVRLSLEVEIPKLEMDELLFASLVSNALDNALNAVGELPEGKRFVRLSLKASDGRLLLLVANPFLTPPRFVDGVPASDRPGHGYGMHSIRYAVESLGGNCRFAVERFAAEEPTAERSAAVGELFVLQVVINL